MNRYRLVHVTEFSYDAMVSESYNEVRLQPRQDDMQTCLSFRLTTEPQSSPTAHMDYNGNWVHRLNILREHRRLEVEANSLVLVQAPPPLPIKSIRLSDLDRASDELDEFYDLIAPTGYVPHLPSLEPLAKETEGESDGTAAGFALAAMRLVHSKFRYDKGATHVYSSVEDALSSGAGVCQDFAHLVLAIIRMRGLPGRYVSGYLVPRRTAEPGASVEELVGGQASHAWLEVFVPGEGWFGLDPTLGEPVGLRHVRIAYGRDYGDVPPVRGVYKGHAGQHLSVDVRVRPALDDEGREHLQETAAAPPAPPPEAPSQQQAQQHQ